MRLSLCCAYSLNCVQLLVTPWNIARQAPLSTGNSPGTTWQTLTIAKVNKKAKNPPWAWKLLENLKCSVNNICAFMNFSAVETLVLLKNMYCWNIVDLWCSDCEAKWFNYTYINIYIYIFFLHSLPLYVIKRYWIWFPVHQ